MKSNSFSERRFLFWFVWKAGWKYYIRKILLDLPWNYMGSPLKHFLIWRHLGDDILFSLLVNHKLWLSWWKSNNFWLHFSFWILNCWNYTFWLLLTDFLFKISYRKINFRWPFLSWNWPCATFSSFWTNSPNTEQAEQ